KVGFTFLPEDDSGEIEVAIEATPGTVIQATDTVASQVDDYLRKIPEIAMTSVRVGNDLGDENIATIYALLVPEKERDKTTQQVRSLIRSQLDNFAENTGTSITIGRPGGGG